MKTQRSLVSSLRGIVLVLTWQIIYEGVSSSSCQSLPCLYYSNTHSLQAIEISSSKVHSVVPNLHSIEAVDVHVKLNLVYWSEAQPNAIRRLNITSGKVEDVLTDSNLGQIEGIAVEWESGLIYWTDYTNQRIEVAQLDGKNRRGLITQGIRNPRGISVDPRNGYMFWISRGSQPRIERATLSGNNKRTLVNLIRSFLFQPNGLTIDFSGNRLYWIDAFFKRLESIDLNGNNRQYFKTLSTSSHPYDIVLYGGVFYFSDATSQSIGKIDQATKQSLGSYTGLGSGLSSSNVLGMAMFSPLRQPKGSSTFLLFVDKTQQALYQIPLVSDDSSVSKIAMPLPLNSVRGPVGVDFDPIKGRVYWSDGYRDEIFRAHLNGSSQEQIVDHLRTPGGIAVDYVGRNLYWTDRGRNRIEVSRLDGSFRKTLVYRGLYEPVDIVLDVENGYMYWAQGGRGFISKIERSDMDGTNRIVIIRWNFLLYQFPNGLALDKENNRLYFVDDYSHDISFVSLVTRVRTAVLTRPGYAKGTVIHGSFIYWTETQGQGGAVYRADKASGKSVEKVVGGLHGPNDICVYDANDTVQIVNSKCSTNNGGCSHLCLLKPGGYQCACPNEMKLKTDLKTCHFSEFLLFVDSGRKKIFLINLDNQHAQPIALKLGITSTQSPDALDFDPQKRFIYWSDVQLHQISRAHPDGSSNEIIVNSGLQKPKGLAVDYVGRNLYWTDFDANRIEVAKLDGSDRKVLISQNIQKPVDIVLDVINGTMYWSSWSNTRPKIERANMDGSKRTILVRFSNSQQPARPNGLALDPETNRLYWVDANKYVIQYTDLQQGNGATFTLPVANYYLIGRPYGLTLKENTLYWSNYRSLYSADKRTGGNVRRLAGNIMRARDVHVYHNYTAIPGKMIEQF
ncbi:Low-density lipoprotein receptor- protein 6 [Desmophyllum pertusum]|uniref:Low-density lipoprotein receptor- protein 6 n=1 Tax=Desmophyllum pertusum TaxID=174260 RepID=A0A9W9YY59_9CNID|nr:Low-density lipoprotein receptor- protein 6 [Desmophyllum pertusum]